MRLSIGFTGFGPLNGTLDAVAAAEAGGLDGVWSAEHIGFHDAVVPSATYLASTRRLEVGIVGLGPASRHPAMAAAELASLGELGPGRIRAQVGTGDAGLIAKIGARYPRPVATVAGYVRVLREVLAGRELNVELPFAKFDGFQLVNFAGPTPIDVMAIRPRMLRLAAEVGDGVSLSAGASEAYLRDTVDYVEAQLAALGRPRSEFRISAHTFGLIAPDVDEMITTFGALLTTFPAASVAYLARGAFDTDAYLAAMKATRTLEAARLLTPEAISGITLAATPSELEPALRRYAMTGIDELTVLLMTPPPLLPDAVTAIAEHRPQQSVLIPATTEA